MDQDALIELLNEDLATEYQSIVQSARAVPRARVQQANDLGLADVAEALRPLLTQTQEHVRDLQAALGT